MSYSDFDFEELVDMAYDTRIGLPAFQRDSDRWPASKVAALYDSLRKGFPIGTFLFTKNKDLNFSERPFDRTEHGYRTYPIAKYRKNKNWEYLCLDGQQRLTAGILLFKRIDEKEGSLKFYLNLDMLVQRFAQDGVSYSDPDGISEWARAITDGDGYIVSKTVKSTDGFYRHRGAHLLRLCDIATKSGHGHMRREMEKIKYDKDFKDHYRFFDEIVQVEFTANLEKGHPVHVMTKKDNIETVTKIFELINSTGTKLTAVEIVHAVVFDGNTDLRDKLESYKGITDTCEHMDKDGGLLLQAMALLEGLDEEGKPKRSPKKASLPANIDTEMFEEDKDVAAYGALDDVGLYLDSKCGAGLTQTHSLLPAMSILLPMTYVWSKFTSEKKCLEERKKGSSKSFENQFQEKMNRWFVGSVLAERYSSSSDTKQLKDAKTMTDWILTNSTDIDENQPPWLLEAKIRINDLLRATPNKMHGKLIKCLLNNERPSDPIDSHKTVGYHRDINEVTQFHHIWPKKYYHDVLEGEDKSLPADLALNGMFVTPRTNKEFATLHPKDMIIQAGKGKGKTTSMAKLFKGHLIDEKALKELKKGSSKYSSYEKFIHMRLESVIEKLQEYGFEVDDSEDDDS